MSRWVTRRKWVVAALPIAALAAKAVVERKPVFLPYPQARPVLQAMADALPPELKGKPEKALAELWPRWIRGHDAEIRARLVQGEEDSLINFLLFGTSFTRQPRTTSRAIELLAAQKDTGSEEDQAKTETLLGDIVLARVDDLIAALAAPGENERLLLARHLVERQGYRADAPEGRAQARRFLLTNLARVLKEQASYTKVLEAARQLGNPTEEFVKRSTLYQSRGLSVDTSLFPNLAVEQALEALRDRGLLKAGAVRRVAIIGPGLDFTDKAAGYDFYPLQTIQPFALIDSLLRLGLARPGALQVTTFDISPDVNEHIARAAARARRGLSYVVQLPLDPQVHWDPATLPYWEHFGDQVGVPVPPVEVPSSLGPLKLRAVRIRPAIVSRVTPVDLDIVLERLEISATEKFDVIVATNVLVYYNVFEQCLAEANIQQMLRPGGFLLSNNALLELPSLHLRSVDYNTTAYSDRPDDGDHIVWYQRSPS